MLGSEDKHEHNIGCICLNELVPINPRNKQNRNKAEWKKELRETQKTLRAGCSKAEAKLRTAADPFRGAQDGQNLISWRWSIPLPTYSVWWRSMHAISSYRGNRPTHKQTHPQTNTHKPTNRTDCNTLRRSVMKTKESRYNKKRQQLSKYYEIDWMICTCKKDELDSTMTPLKH